MDDFDDGGYDQYDCIPFGDAIRFEENCLAAELAGEKEYDADYISQEECVTNGSHLLSCDDDGYCNYCGNQLVNLEEEAHREEMDI